MHICGTRGRWVKHHFLTWKSSTSNVMEQQYAKFQHNSASVTVWWHHLMQKIFSKQKLGPGYLLVSCNNSVYHSWCITRRCQPVLPKKNPNGYSKCHGVNWVYDGNWHINIPHWYSYIDIVHYVLLLWEDKPENWEIKRVATLSAWSKHSMCHRFNSSHLPLLSHICLWIRSALVQIMACCLFRTKPLSKPMLDYCQWASQEQPSVKS